MSSRDNTLKKCDELIARLKQLKGALNGNDLEKSNYGKLKDVGGKTVSQYNPADNASRKMNNTGDRIEGIGQNANAKAYSTRPGQLSAKQSASAEAAKLKSINRKQPVKTYTPEQIAAINEANKLKKNAENNPWVQHGCVPNADQELAKMQRANPVERAENLMANQLANLMQGRAMLGQSHKQPTAEDFIRAGEAMGLAPSEEQLQKAEDGWNNRMNWLQEAVKPISARFNSPEEEAAYWDSIKVNGSGKDDYGF
jgi:hypothetical protein